MHEDTLIAFMVYPLLVIAIVAVPLCLYKDYKLTEKICEKRYKDKDDYDYCMAKQHVIIDAQQ